MQTRGKVVGINSSREHASQRSCRQQKKIITMAEAKVTELITSSARKQRNVGVRPRRLKDAQGALKLDTNYDSTQEQQTEGICMTFKSSLSHELSENTSTPDIVETIFSPGFHLAQDVCGGVDKDDFRIVFRSKNQAGNEEHVVEDLKIDETFNFYPTIEAQQNPVENTGACDEISDSFSGSSEDGDRHHSYTSLMTSNHIHSSTNGEYSALQNLSTEVSAIYLAMQHSKLECIDEPSNDSVSTDGCDSEEDDELDDFNPYQFIKNLPDLSSVVPTFRSTLLPKQTRSCPSTTLVLDLDETLVHSLLEPCKDADFTFPVDFNLKQHTVYVRCRPYLKEFLERVSNLFEIIIFTASQSIYAERLLNVLDPKRRLFRHRIYRESCVYLDGNYLKDLSVLGRDLAHVAIIDNSPQTFGFQVDNGIPIESWFDDRKDQELLALLPFLESLVGVADVRPVIAKKFNLREKVASAPCVF